MERVVRNLKMMLRHPIAGDLSGFPEGEELDYLRGIFGAYRPKQWHPDKKEQQIASLRAIIDTGAGIPTVDEEGCLWRKLDELSKINKWEKDVIAKAVERFLASEEKKIVDRLTGLERQVNRELFQMDDEIPELNTFCYVLQTLKNTPYEKNGDEDDETKERNNTGNSLMLFLLKQNDWGKFQTQFDELRAWEYYPLLIRTLKVLKHEELYESHTHGLGHIERTILQGAFCAMAEGLNYTDTELLLKACSYHDTGREDDWEDHGHGKRAAVKMDWLTDERGDNLAILRGAVDAHDVRDDKREEILQSYGVRNLERGKEIAILLKDSDGLDRVRLGPGALDVNRLRRESSKKRKDLSIMVCNKYIALERELSEILSKDE